MFKRDRDPNPGFYPTIIKEQFPSRPQIWYDKGTKFTWKAGPGVGNQLDPFSIQSGAQHPAQFNLNGAVPDVQGVQKRVQEAQAQQAETQRLIAKDLEQRAQLHKETVEIDARSTARVGKHTHYTERKARQDPTPVNIKVNDAFNQRHKEQQQQMEEHKRRNQELQRELQRVKEGHDKTYAELQRANQQNDEWAQWHSQQQNYDQPEQPPQRREGVSAKVSPLFVDPGERMEEEDPRQQYTGPQFNYHDQSTYVRPEPETQRDVLPPEYVAEPYRHPTEQDYYYDPAQYNDQRNQDFYSVPEQQRQEDLSQFAPWRQQERKRQRLPEPAPRVPEQETQGRNEFERQDRRDRDREPDAVMTDAFLHEPDRDRVHYDLSQANQRSEELAKQLRDLQQQFEYVNVRRGPGDDRGDGGQAASDMQDQYARLQAKLDESQRYAQKLEQQVGQANQLTKSTLQHLQATESHLSQTQIRLTQYDDEMVELQKQLYEQQSLSTKQELEVYALQSEVKQMRQLHSMDRKDREKILITLQREKDQIRNQAKNLTNKLQQVEINLEKKKQEIFGMEQRAKQQEQMLNDINLQQQNEIEQINNRLQDVEARRQGELQKNNRNEAIILQNENTIDELRRKKEELERFIQGKIQRMTNESENERNLHQYEIQEANSTRVKLEEEVQLLKITMAQAESERQRLVESELRQDGIVTQLRDELNTKTRNLQQTVTAKDEMIRKLNAFVDEEKKKTIQLKANLDASQGNYEQMQNRLAEIQSAGDQQNAVLVQAQAEIRDLKIDIVHMLRDNAVGLNELTSLQEKYELEIRKNEGGGPAGNRIPLVASADALAEQARLAKQIEELTRSLEVQKQAVREAEAVALKATQVADELKKNLEQEEELALHIPIENIPILIKQITKHFNDKGLQLPNSILEVNPKFGDVVRQMQVHFPARSDPSYDKYELLIKAAIEVQRHQDQMALDNGNVAQNENNLIKTLQAKLRNKVKEDNRRKGVLNQLGIIDPGTGVGIADAINNLKAENSRQREAYERGIELERKLKDELAKQKEETKSIVVQRDRMQDELIDLKNRNQVGADAYNELLESMEYQKEEIKEREKKIELLAAENSRLLHANDMNDEQRILEQQEVQKNIQLELQSLQQAKIEVQSTVQQIQQERERIDLQDRELFVRQTKMEAQQQILEVSSQKVQLMEKNAMQAQFEVQAIKSQTNAFTPASRVDSILNGMSQAQADELFQEIMSQVSAQFPYDNSIRGTIYADDAVSALSSGNKFAQFRNPSLISDSHSIIPAKVTGFYDISDAESSFYLSQAGIRKPNARRPAQVLDVVDSEMEGHDEPAPPAAVLSDKGIPATGAGISDRNSAIPRAAGGVVFGEVHSSSAREFVSRLSIAMLQLAAMKAQQAQQAQEPVNLHAAATDLEQQPRMTAEALKQFDATFAQNFEAKNLAKQQKELKKFGPKSIGSRAPAKNAIFKTGTLTKKGEMEVKRLKKENLMAKKALRRVFGGTRDKKAELLPLRASVFAHLNASGDFLPDLKAELGFARNPTPALPPKPFMEDRSVGSNAWGQSIQVRHGTDHEA